MASLEQAVEDSDQQASRDVNSHGAERKCRKEVVLYETGQKETKYSPAETSQTDDQ